MTAEEYVPIVMAVEGELEPSAMTVVHDGSIAREEPELFEHVLVPNDPGVINEVISSPIKRNSRNGGFS